MSAVSRSQSPLHVVENGSCYQSFQFLTEKERTRHESVAGRIFFLQFQLHTTHILPISLLFFQKLPHIKVSSEKSVRLGGAPFFCFMRAIVVIRALFLCFIYNKVLADMLPEALHLVKNGGFWREEVKKISFFCGVNEF